MKKYLILSLLLCSCESLADKVKELEERDRMRTENEKIRRENYFPELNLSRGHYRGHQYIYNHGRYNFTFIHDPDCPCYKKGSRL